MKTYARIQNAVVLELLTTAGDPTHLFNPALQWREVTTPGVQVGWIVSATGFAAPVVTTPAAASLPTLAELQRELAALVAKFAAFSVKSGG